MIEYSPAPEIRDTGSGKIAVITPYHADVVAGCKRLMGRWGHVLLEGGQMQKAWILPARHREKAQALLDRCFPQETDMAEVIVRWNSNPSWARQVAYQAPRLGGTPVVSFKRDWVSRVRHPHILEVLDMSLFTGGSLQHPTIWGRLEVVAYAPLEVPINKVADWPGVYGNGTVSVYIPETTEGGN